MMMDEVTTRLQASGVVESSAYGALEAVGCRALERHLEERAGNSLSSSGIAHAAHMQHAATNTTGLAHLRLQSGAATDTPTPTTTTPLSSSSSLSSSVATGQATTPLKKKRGPKAGRRAALAAAEAAARANQQAFGCIQAQQQQQQQHASDPYAFHCDSAHSLEPRGCLGEQELALNDRRQQAGSFTKRAAAYGQEQCVPLKQELVGGTVELHAHCNGQLKQASVAGFRLSNARTQAASNKQQTTINYNAAGLQQQQQQQQQQQPQQTTTSNFSSLRASHSQAATFCQTQATQDEGRLNYSGARQFQASSREDEQQQHTEALDSRAACFELGQQRAVSQQRVGQQQQQQQPMIAHKQQQQQPMRPIGQLGGQAAPGAQPVDFYHEQTLVEQPYALEASQPQLYRPAAPQQQQQQQPMQQQRFVGGAHQFGGHQEQLVGGAQHQAQLYAPQHHFGPPAAPQADCGPPRPNQTLGAMRQQQQRMSPYPSQQQQQQPVRCSANQAQAISMQQQQYANSTKPQTLQQQLAASQANAAPPVYNAGGPQQQQPMAYQGQFAPEPEQLAHPQQQQQQVGGPPRGKPAPVIVHYKPERHQHQQQHCVSGAPPPPTLLQQQLNRQQAPPPMHASMQQPQPQPQVQHPHQRLAPAPPTHQQQQQQQQQLRQYRATPTQQQQTLAGPTTQRFAPSGMPLEPNLFGPGEPQLVGTRGHAPLDQFGQQQQHQHQQLGYGGPQQQQQQQPSAASMPQRNLQNPLQRQPLEPSGPPQHAPPPHLLGNPTPPLTPTAASMQPGSQRLLGQQQGNNLEQQWHPHHAHPMESTAQAQQSAGYAQRQQLQRSLPLKTGAFNGPQQQAQQYAPPPPQPPLPPSNHLGHAHPHQLASHTSQQATLVEAPNGAHHLVQQQQQQQQQQLLHQRSTVGLHQQQAALPSSVSPPAALTRLTLPLLGAPLLGPFKLEHDAQFTSKVFHIKPQLFDTLSKSMSLNPQTATVTHELQFRAYLSANANKPNDSLLASNQALGAGKACHWPELFQVCVNQNVVQLDRGQQICGKSNALGQHKAVDIFQLCQPNENILDLQVNDCYCSHEFLLEPVERPTLKAFMNSCFKSRLLSVEACLQKMRFNFNSAGFLIQQQAAHSAPNQAPIINEYITEFNQQTGLEQTKSKISLRCPITGHRMRTPTRGHNCKHLQCFDLESFLFMNRERSQWSCPICSLSIPFNMLELDQHQINIAQAMQDVSATDEVLLDCQSGSPLWQPYYSPALPPLQQSALGHAHQQAPQPPPPPSSSSSLHKPAAHSSSPHAATPIHMHTAKATGTYHPQAPPLAANGAPLSHSHQHQHHAHQQQQQPMRPMSGPMLGAASLQQQQRPASNISMPASSSPAAHWDSPQHSSSNEMLANNQPPRGRRSANGSPLAKRPYAGQFAQQAPPSQAFVEQPQVMQQQQANFLIAEQQTTPNFAEELTDDISPLAAMERTIIQHEQQMGPPPFDANALTSSSPLRGAQPANNNSLSSSVISCQQPQNSAQQQQQQQQQPARPNSLSPEAQQARNQQAAAFSPLSQSASAVQSPARVAASPQQQQQQRLNSAVDPPPQSPMQQQQQHTSISTPATPSSMLIHGGPETPATPGNSQQQQSCGGPNSAGAPLGHTTSPHVASANNSNSSGALQSGGVDHQPLSNGSASAGSITSSSTMTPSGQSLGSVGMGGDSRCGTAPLQQNSLGLDELLGNIGSSASHLLGSSGSAGQSGALGSGNAGQRSPFVKSHSSIHGLNSPQIDDKNDILLGKLMMDAGENSALMQQNNASELALALEEAEWKQQLDSSRGKSEHLANFLNEPLMNKQHLSHHHHHHHQHNHHAYQSGQNSGSLINNNNNNNTNNNNPANNHNKLISGGLNPSDDEGGNQSHNSSPSHNIDQLEFANYLDSEGADNGAGLPPDDSILDLFER